MRRTGVVALALLLALAGEPAGAAPRRVEAESGTIDNSLCGGVSASERMEVSSGRDDGSVYVVFTGDGCTLSFDELAGVRRITALRFAITGMSGELCGRFEFSGGLFGTSRPLCTESRDWLKVPVTTSARAGPFTIRWLVGDATPLYVNGFLDYVEVA